MQRRMYTRGWPHNRLVHCAIAVSSAVLGSHKNNVRCIAVEEQLEAKEVQLLQPSGSTSLLMISSGLSWGSSSTSLLMISSGLTWGSSSTSLLLIWPVTLVYNVLQFSTCTRTFSVADRRFSEDSNVVAERLWPLLPNQDVSRVKRLIKEDPRIAKMRRRQFEPFIGSLDWILRHHLGVRKRCAHQLTEKQRRGMASRSNSKHWFTTSFLPWRKVPESDARSVLRGLTKAGQSVSGTSSLVRVWPETKQ